jgi:hypothetical protein
VGKFGCGFDLRPRKYRPGDRDLVQPRYAEPTFFPIILRSLLNPFLGRKPLLEEPGRPNEEWGALYRAFLAFTFDAAEGNFLSPLEKFWSCIIARELQQVR